MTVDDGHQGACILVVEDDEDLRTSIRDALEEAGYAVRTAAHGRQALDVMTRSGRPCLVFLDLMMPVMDGFDLLASMHANPELTTIPVVIVAASQPATPPGGTKILRKPVGLKALLREAKTFCSACGATGSKN